MTMLITAPLTGKAQLTLPKKIRETLGVRDRGDVVGFLLDQHTRRIVLTKVDLTPAEEPLSSRELRKLVRVTRKGGGRTFSSAEAFLKHLHSL